MNKRNLRRKRALRDRYGSACFYCGVSLTLAEMTIDHYVPRARGGTDDIDNRRPACQVCNALKADDLPEVFAERARILRALRAVQDRIDGVS